ncbi:MAG: hypothetical protein NT076_05540 [Candidatus Pacearchaeota archaeon]|nr:hypothetical protein [Candidatus Pacearchaeota archaeon]
MMRLKGLGKIIATGLFGISDLAGLAGCSRMMSSIPADEEVERSGNIPYRKLGAMEPSIRAIESGKHLVRCPDNEEMIILAPSNSAVDFKNVYIVNEKRDRLYWYVKDGNWQEGMSLEWMPIPLEIHRSVYSSSKRLDIPSLRLKIKKPFLNEKYLLFMEYKNGEKLIEREYEESNANPANCQMNCK